MADPYLEGKTIEKQTRYYIELDDNEKLKRYRERVEWAKNKTAHWRTNAEVFLTYYRNKPKVFTKGGQKVVVPIAIKNVDAMFAALTAFQIVPVVAPKGTTTYDMAMVQQELVRNEWDSQEVAETTEYAIKESLVTGIGFAKVGYEFEEETEEEDIRGETAGGMATETVEDTVVVKDRVLVEHIPYDELYFDPEAKKWEDVTWVCQKFELPLEEVKADPRYSNTDDLGHSTTVSEAWRPTASKHSGDHPDAQRVVMYEFWDLVRGNICWFAEGHEDILREGINPYVNRIDMHKRNPYVPYITRKDIGEVIGIGDIQAQKTVIDEANVLRSSTATYVERMKPKLLSDEGVFTDQGKKALRSQEWGEVVELRKGAILQQSVKPMEMPTLPQEAFMLAGTAAQDANDAIGMNELLGAQLPVGRKTATAMAQLGQATTVRQSEKRNSLERFYRKIADRMLYLMKSYYEQPRVVREVTDMGDVVWEFNNEDIDFESQVMVELEPKEVLDSESKREKFMAMLNVLATDPYVNQPELKKFVFEQGLNIPKDIVRKFIRTEEEAQQMMQMQANMQNGQNGQGGGTEFVTPQNIPFSEQVESGTTSTAQPGVLG